MIPSQEQPVQNNTLRLYWIVPEDIKGQRTLVKRAGRILNSATTPLGVEAGTKSNAADRIITYRTIDQHVVSVEKVSCSGATDHC